MLFSPVKRTAGGRDICVTCHVSGVVPLTTTRPLLPVSQRSPAAGRPQLGPLPSQAVAMREAPPQTSRASSVTATQSDDRTLLCVAITATTSAEALQQIQQAVAAKADSVELRLDFLEDFQADSTLEQLLDNCSVPAIVTYRAEWEGRQTSKHSFLRSGKHRGKEEDRLGVLRKAVALGAAFVDVELKAADGFFAGLQHRTSSNTKIILSSHDYQGTPDDAALDSTVHSMFEAGADIAKIATTATDITNALHMLRLPARHKGPVIGLAMGERGLISRLLAGKFGGFLTFGRLEGGLGSAPGQPLLSELQNMYRVHSQRPDTKVLGVIGNPVGHSKSPLLHNAALQHAGINSVYVPLLVDDLPHFLRTCPKEHFSGFSITIPHKVTALECADEIDPMADRIGALNTLVRSPDGQLKGFNTDWSAAIIAIEEGLGGRAPSASSLSAFAEDSDADRQASNAAASSSQTSPLEGLRVVVLGAGGAGRALAFGAADKGAHVIIANRNVDKAKQLAAAIGPDVEVVTPEDIFMGRVHGDVLINSTSIGMQPNQDVSPGPRQGLEKYKLVFDVVYTPPDTLLLRDAAKAGCSTVSGLEMFVGQAAQQYVLFTDSQAPYDLLKQTLLQSIEIK